MKLLRFLLALVCGSIASNAGAQQVLPYTFYTSGGSVYNSTTNYTIISARSKTGGDPVLTFVSATSDLAGSRLQFYTNGVFTSSVLQNNTTALYVLNSAGFAAGNLAVMQHFPSGTSEMVIVSSVAFGGITIAQAPQLPFLPGDIIYAQGAAGSVPVGASTITLNSVGIYSGQRKKPMLMTLSGTTTFKINTVTATYTSK